MSPYPPPRNPDNPMPAPTPIPDPAGPDVPADPPPVPGEHRPPTRR